jgi:rubrerythrin
MSTTNLLDAIRVVKENERIASASYADAAQKVSNPIGKDLFEQLAKFEKFHYDKLTALEASLETKGDYISYEGREFPLPPVFEIKAAQEPNSKTIMSIIKSAMDLEKIAEKSYAELAAQIEDPKGHAMFYKLADEEHNHWRLLSEAYWNLNNLETWKWSRP